MTVYQTYYCEHCRDRYSWTQERSTPGFCSIKCQADDATRKSLMPFKLQQLAKAIESVAVKATDVVEQRKQRSADSAVIREQRCECCNINSYLGRPLQFVLRHSDGNINNNAPNNLQLLCPNCASQADNSEFLKQAGVAQW